MTYFYDGTLDNMKIRINRDNIAGLATIAVWVAWFALAIVLR
jgi:hypothetical protein